MLAATVDPHYKVQTNIKGKHRGGNKLNLVIPKVLYNQYDGHVMIM